MKVICNKADECGQEYCEHRTPHEEEEKCTEKQCDEFSPTIGNPFSVDAKCVPFIDNTIKWNKIEDGDPGYDGSDQHYLVILHSKFITVSFFFCDSYRHWWSSQWDLYDKEYSSGEVTHWAKLPLLP